MRWIAFFILAYLALGLQLGIARAMDIGGAKPDFVLLAVIFIAMNAPRDAALLGSFILGIFQDLTAQQTLGLYSFTYGCVGLFIFSAQSAVYRKHPLTHVALAMAMGLVVAVILIAHNRLRLPTGSRPAALPIVYSAAYSAVLAPVVIGILQRMRRIFGFENDRPARGALSMRRN